MSSTPGQLYKSRTVRDAYSTRDCEIVAAMPRKILVASYTSNITTLSFEAAVSPPSLSVVSSLEVGHHPSWITPHETDTSIVFTANEQPNGTVKAIRIDLSSGEGKVVADMHVGGDDPCHLVVSGSDLVTANVSLAYCVPSSKV